MLLKIVMESDISDEDIDALLQDTDFKSEAPSAPIMSQSLKEDSLEKLLGEILSPNSPIAERSPTLPTHKEIHKRSKMSLTPIWLSIAILGVFLLGGALGFYWGKTRPGEPALTNIHTQLSTLLEEVRKLSQWVDPPSPPKEEIIEPLEIPDDLKMPLI